MYEFLNRPRPVWVHLLAALILIAIGARLRRMFPGVF